MINYKTNKTNYLELKKKLNQKMVKNKYNKMKMNKKIKKKSQVLKNLK